MSNIKDHPKLLNKYYGKYTDDEPYVVIFNTEQERDDWVNSEILFPHKGSAELRKMIVTVEQLKSLLNLTDGNFTLYEPEKICESSDEAFQRIYISPAKEKEVTIPIDTIYKMRKTLSELHYASGQANTQQNKNLWFSPQAIDERFNELTNFFQKYLA